MILPLMAHAEAVEIDGIYYNLITKIKKAEVTSGYYKGNVVIPSSVVYNDVTYSVTSIGEGAFQYCSGLTSVTIPNSVTFIGGGSFYYCKSLTAVYITDLDAWCKIEFTNENSNPLYYAHHLYLNDKEIKELVIPNSVTAIGELTFRGWSSLTSITIPNSVTTIGQKAFSGCSGLTSITFPNSVTSIGVLAFDYCSSLEAVHITDLEAWCKMEFADYSTNPLYYAHHLYLNGKEVKDLVIPNSVTSIGQNTFTGCSGLTSVTIPNSVTTIGQNAFSGCSGLTSITIPNSVTSIGGGAFFQCRGLTSVTIPNSVTHIGQATFYYCSSLTSIAIPNSVVTIGLATFENCSGLTSVSIPNSITSIGQNAFSGCSGLTSVTIPNSVTIIGQNAFENCNGLTSTTIPNSVTSIEERAFYNCSGLTSITIGSGVTQINGEAFGYCPELTDVYCYAENVPSTITNAFNESLIEFATLHVPGSALYAYNNTAPWSNFKYKVAIGEGEQSYTLTYMLDGIKYVESNVREGETITPEPAPAKIGYTFSGWSEIPETMPAHDVTITGSFTVNKYNLIYKVDDADHKTYELEYGTTITPEPVPTKVGYNFSGWSEIPETMPDHDVTVSGIFIPKTYLPGDANGDGQITVTDIGVIVDIILGKAPANARKQQEAEPQ